MEIYLEAPTKWGLFAIGATAKGLSSLFFPGAATTAVLCDPGPVSQEAHRSARNHATRGISALCRYIEGSPMGTVSLDVSWATPFMRDIYMALLAVPPGQTVSYGELAALAGHPGAQRAVGGAMKRNRLPLFVPCHRVIASGGRIGGWSGQEGWKPKLLAHEGATVGVRVSKTGEMV